MNILHLNALIDGGAASGAYRLHEAMLQQGINSKILTGKKNNADSNTFAVGNKNRYVMAIERRVFNALKTKTDMGQYFFQPMSLSSPSADVLVQSVPFKPDLIIAHWTTGLTDAEGFYKLQKKYKVPFIWYMSDMEPMTAGCHYVFSCDKYKNKCTDCEAFRSGWKWIPAHYYNNKEKYINQMDLKIVASSSFMLNMAEECSLFRNLKKIVVHRGIDSNVFNPTCNRTELRNRWKITDKDIVLFFGVQSFSEKRKGMKQLLAALNLLHDRLKDKHSVMERITIFIAGKNDNISDKIPFKSVYAGFMKAQKDLASLYQVADAYICPTLQDSGPMMASESLMCGTPVIGYRMGVLPDVVQNGATGYLADVGSIDGLADCIEQFIMLSDEQRNKMKKASVDFAMENLTYEQQVHKILKFAQLL